MNYPTEIYMFMGKQVVVDNNPYLIFSFIEHAQGSKLILSIYEDQIQIYDLLDYMSLTIKNSSNFKHETITLQAKNDYSSAEITLEINTNWSLFKQMF